METCPEELDPSDLFSESVSGSTTGVDDSVAGVEEPVGEIALAQGQPDPLDWIKLGTGGRKPLLLL